MNPYQLFLCLLFAYITLLISVGWYVNYSPLKGQSLQSQATMPNSFFFDVSQPIAHIPFGLCVLPLAPRPISKRIFLLDNSVPESINNYIIYKKRIHV